MSKIADIQGSFYRIQEAAAAVQVSAPEETVAEVLIFDRIGKDIFGESVDAAEFVAALNDIDADRLIVRINSPGGSVPDGIAIHNALRRHSATTEISIEGMAVSIASMVAMAGDSITMADNALMMMHAPWALVMGNSRDMRKFADVLDKHAEAMATAYTRVAEDRDDDIRGMLTDGEDHWFTAAEAREFGLVEEVTESVPMEASFDLSHIQQDHIPAAAAALMSQEATMPDRNKQGRTANRPKNPNPQNPAGDGNAGPAPAPATPAAPPEPSATDRDAATIRAEALAAETERRQTIRAAFEKWQGYQGVPELMNQCLDDTGVTADAARTHLLNKIGEGAEPLGGASEAAAEVTDDEADKRRRAKTESLLARMGMRDIKGEDGKPIVSDGANPYRGLSLGELARASLREVGVDVTGQGVDQFAQQALAWQVQAAGGQTTSDFPVILEDAMHKMVIHFYDAQPVKYPRFCRIGQVSDFRAHQRHAPGMIGGLDKKNEAGEYVNKNLPDNEKQTIQAEEYGNVIVIDRKVLVNDDIGQIQALTQDIGMAAARGVDRDAFAVLANNPTLADGTPLFHADHGNLASGGAAPTVTLIAEGADTIADQKAPGEDDVPLDIQATVAVSRHTVARNINKINNSEFDPDSTNKFRDRNTVYQQFSDVVGSPRISGPEWYMFADPSIAPVLEVAFLNGQNVPRLLQEEHFRTGSLQWRPTLDYAVGAVGYRGGWKNPGDGS